MAPRELHITVASGWSDRTGLDVGHEVELVKSALLYADHVTLASPRVSLLASFATVLSMDEQQRADAVLQILRGQPANATIVATLDKLEAKRHKTPAELIKLRDIRTHLKAAGQELSDRIEGMLTAAGVDELGLAMGAGLLDLDPLGVESGSTDEMAKNLANLLVEVSTPGSRTYPLLDESTNGWLRALVKEGRVPPSSAGLGKEPTLGTRWIGEMEAFPHAHMSAVLELREALQEPLVRYRSAIIGISENLDATPVDDEFARAASEAYRQAVAPELLNLVELARERRVTSLLRHAATTGPGAKTLGAGVGFVAADEADFPRLVGAAVGAGAEVLASAYRRRKEVIDEQRQSDFFFLYEVEQRLKG